MLACRTAISLSLQASKKLMSGIEKDQLDNFTRLRTYQKEPQASADPKAKSKQKPAAKKRATRANPAMQWYVEHQPRLHKVFMKVFSKPSLMH